MATMAVDSTNAISCYECDSSNNFSCTEFWDPTLPVTSQYYSNCSHVFEARYCVKMTGVFDGKLGTKRFCSSKDWETIASTSRGLEVRAYLGLIDQ